ncbi:MAG: amino acid ABC transporter permease [Clostridiales bacterium]|nr:amino acid ABC transporter permease [Clostridiales bacterium]
MEKYISTIKLLSGGFVITLEIFAYTLVFSVILGLLVSKGRMSRNPVIRSLVRIYISVMRGTPLMLQLLLVYYLPYYMFGVKTGNIKIGPYSYDFIATIIAFTVNYAAYFAEIFRSGIQSMPKGQYEAAQILGFSKSQTFFRIILPQVFKRVLPAMTNEIITLVKDTSLSRILSIKEMFFFSSSAAARMSSIMPFIIAGVFYYVFNGIIEITMNRVEKKLDYYQ